MHIAHVSYMQQTFSMQCMLVHLTFEARNYRMYSRKIKKEEMLLMFYNGSVQSSLARYVTVFPQRSSPLACVKTNW